MRPLSLVLLCGLAVMHAGPGWCADNKLPDEASQALANPGYATLYSLEPWAMPGGPTDRFYDRAVLGDVDLSKRNSVSAAAAIGQAVAGWDGIDVGCFDPRQALHVKSGDVSYDFLISYQCHKLEVYKDGKKLAQVGVFGDDRALNDLLTAEKIPLSRSGQMMSR